MEALDLILSGGCLFMRRLPVLTCAPPVPKIRTPSLANGFSSRVGQLKRARD